MTDYLPFTSDEYAVDAPATSLHFERWFRNWEAGFEGAPGATRMRAAAHYGPGVGSVIQRNCLPCGPLTVRARDSQRVSVHIVGEMTALVSCTVRITYSVGSASSSGGGSSRNFSFFKNGVALASTVNVVTDQVIDVALTPGDSIGGKIEVQGGDSLGSGSLTLSKLEYTVDTTTAGLI